MIQTISIVNDNQKINFPFDKNESKKMVIDYNFGSLNTKSFDIEIEFLETIIAVRNHNYTWVKVNNDFIANEFSPKIIKFLDGTCIQANINYGIWEINKNKKNILLWRFNPENFAPITSYSGIKNEKVIRQANQDFLFDEFPSLLFTKKSIEFSRSKISFSAIAVFTDHCDFDTLENLKLQRIFFKKYNIKITKGFFLHHFSKREDNASFENNSDEITKWHEDGHELCYHSLSQSIKSDNESLSDFYNFSPPFPDTTTWIDHGYQPYNFSLFENQNIENQVFENNLIQKKINILWNYIDSGTSTSGVINQLNPKHFTLSSFMKGNHDLPFLKKMQLMLKNIIFHFYGDEQLIIQYKNTASNFKKVFLQRKLKNIFSLFSNFTKLSFAIILVFISWNKSKNKPYKLAKYSPILFKHIIAKQQFYIFQTLEMIDFKKALSPKNIDILIAEKGIFIAHTYFSVPMSYHKGKMFSDSNSIDSLVANNFENLGEKIRNNQIWNPTLKELTQYWTNFDKLVLDIDNQGSIIVKNITNLVFRTID